MVLGIVASIIVTGLLSGTNHTFDGSNPGIFVCVTHADCFKWEEAASLFDV